MNENQSSVQEPEGTVQGETFSALPTTGGLGVIFPARCAVVGVMSQTSSLLPQPAPFLPGWVLMDFFFFLGNFSSFTVHCHPSYFSFKQQEELHRYHNCYNKYTLNTYFKYGDRKLIGTGC